MHAKALPQYLDGQSLCFHQVGGNAKLRYTQSTMCNDHALTLLCHRPLLHRPIELLHVALIQFTDSSKFNFAYVCQQATSQHSEHYTDSMLELNQESQWPN